MKELKKIIDINEFSHFELTDKEICFIDKNKIMNVIELDTFMPKYLIPLDRCYLFDTDNQYIYIYIQNKGIYRVENGFINLYWESDYTSNFIFNKAYIIATKYNADTDIKSVAFYDRETKELMWNKSDKNTSIIRTYNAVFFADDFKNPTYIENINIQNGKVKWKKYFEPKVYGEIMQYNEKIIIPLKNNHLLGLNAQTGEKLWELEDCFNYYNLDEKTGLLYGYAGERFDIIDAAKGEKIVEKRFIGSMDKYQISPDQNMNVLAGDALYFVSNWNVSTKFGKINIKTQEIEFVQKLIPIDEKGARTIANKPVYHNGRLYILDSVGTLHIFEEDR
jgi:outer membrane protein assembly factor BamB